MQLNLIIDRFEGEAAVLKTEQGKSIIWPKNKLPKNALEGTVLSFIVQTQDKAEEERKKTAKEILNEVLDLKD